MLYPKWYLWRSSTWRHIQVPRPWRFYVRRKATRCLCLGNQSGKIGNQCQYSGSCMELLEPSIVANWNLFAEPVSSTAPKVPPLQSRPMIVPGHTDLSILCPAQGYPAPSFRSVFFQNRKIHFLLLMIPTFRQFAALTLLNFCNFVTFAFRRAR